MRHDVSAGVGHAETSHFYCKHTVTVDLKKNTKKYCIHPTDAGARRWHCGVDYVYVDGSRRPQNRHGHCPGARLAGPYLRCAILGCWHFTMGLVMYLLGQQSRGWRDDGGCPGAWADAPFPPHPTLCLARHGGQRGRELRAAGQQLRCVMHCESAMCRAMSSHNQAAPVK